MGLDFTSSTLNYPTGADRPIKRVMVNRAPLPSDNKNFILGDEWLDTNAFDWWKLVRVSGNPSVAEWILLGSGNLQFLTGNSGGQISADPSNNINIIGTAPINVTGNPATNTLTISTSSLGNLSTLSGNSGGAITADGADNINIVGSAGTDVVGTGVNNTLTVTANGALLWSVITLNQVAVKNNGYFTNGVGVVQVALPAVSVVGDTFDVADIGGNGFRITQGAGQQIRNGNVLSTLGVGGSVSSTLNGNHLRLVCFAANTSWIAIDQQGNFIVV